MPIECKFALIITLYVMLFTKSCSVVKSDLGQASPSVSNLEIANDGPGSQGESQTDGNTQGVPLRSSKGVGEGEREKERENNIFFLITGGTTNGGNGVTNDSQPSRLHHKRPGGSLPESK